MSLRLCENGYESPRDSMISSSWIDWKTLSYNSKCVRKYGIWFWAVWGTNTVWYQNAFASDKMFLTFICRPLSLNSECVHDYGTTEKRFCVTQWFMQLGLVENTIFEL